jgi:small subunit ribosomal protein S20
LPGRKCVSMEVVLPHKKSAIKRLRQDEGLNARNKAMKSRMATAVKKAVSAPTEEREAALRAAISVIDKAVKVGAIKKATGDRKKSRLTKTVQSA